MARESGKGADRKSRGSDRDSRKKDTKKSGWSKPDGTPLRKRKGDYFPDKEIDKRKPAARGKYAKEGYPRDRDTDKPREFKRSEGGERSRDFDKPREYKKSDSSFRDRNSDKPREYKRSEDGERSRDFDKPREYKKSDSSFRDCNSDKPREFKRSEGDSGSRDFDKPREYKKSDSSFRDRNSDKPREYKRSEDGERSRDFDKPREYKKPDSSFRDRNSDKPREYKRSEDGERSRDFDKPREYKKPESSFRDRDSDKPRDFKRTDRTERDRSDSPRDFKKSGSNYGDYKRAGSARDRDNKPREYTKREEGSSDSETRKPKKFSKPAFERKGKKPFEKKRERYADKDHSKEMRGRFDKDRSKPKRNAAGPHRERKTGATADPASKDAIRLNRYIANAGICSRREADDLISAGLVSINGEIVTELGTKVMPGDVVKFNEQTLKTEKLVYVLLNKPKDFLTTTDDPEERKTVMSLVKEAGKERIFPVGRLDRNTTGLLLLTNDGELTKRLTHPSGNIKKLYQVELDKNLTQADMIKAAEGIELEDGIIAFDEIQYASPDDKSIIGVELHSGKNRIVRRIFEAMGYEVRKLDRTTFAGLTKKDLPRGRWRFLTEMELNMLRMLTGKKK